MSNSASSGYESLPDEQDQKRHQDRPKPLEAMEFSSYQNSDSTTEPPASHSQTDSHLCNKRGKTVTISNVRCERLATCSCWTSCLQRLKSCCSGTTLRTRLSDSQLQLAERLTSVSRNADSPRVYPKFADFDAVLAPLWLAFSGGGIRSAYFQAGVISYLCSDGLRIHFQTKKISSVSGGGYVSSALLATWFKRSQFETSKRAPTVTCSGSNSKNVLISKDLSHQKELKEDTTIKLNAAHMDTKSVDEHPKKELPITVNRYLDFEVSCADLAKALLDKMKNDRSHPQYLDVGGAFQMLFIFLMGTGLVTWFFIAFAFVLEEFYYHIEAFPADDPSLSSTSPWALLAIIWTNGSNRGIGIVGWFLICIAIFVIGVPFLSLLFNALLAFLLRIAQLPRKSIPPNLRKCSRGCRKLESRMFSSTVSLVSFGICLLIIYFSVFVPLTVWIVEYVYFNGLAYFFTVGLGVPGSIVSFGSFIVLQLQGYALSKKVALVLLPVLLGLFYHFLLSSLVWYILFNDAASGIRWLMYLGPVSWCVVQPILGRLLHEHYRRKLRELFYPDDLPTQVDEKLSATEKLDPQLGEVFNDERFLSVGFYFNTCMDDRIVCIASQNLPDQNVDDEECRLYAANLGFLGSSPLMVVNERRQRIRLKELKHGRETETRQSSQPIIVLPPLASPVTATVVSDTPISPPISLPIPNYMLHSMFDTSSVPSSAFNSPASSMLSTNSSSSAPEVLSSSTAELVNSSTVSHDEEKVPSQIDLVKSTKFSSTTPNAHEPAPSSVQVANSNSIDLPKLRASVPSAQLTPEENDKLTAPVEYLTSSPAAINSQYSSTKLPQAEFESSDTVASELKLCLRNYWQQRPMSFDACRCCCSQAGRVSDSELYSSWCTINLSTVMAASGAAVAISNGNVEELDHVPIRLTFFLIPLQLGVWIHCEQGHGPWTLFAKEAICTLGSQLLYIVAAVGFDRPADSTDHTVAVWCGIAYFLLCFFLSLFANLFKASFLLYAVPVRSLIPILGRRLAKTPFNTIPFTLNQHQPPLAPSLNQNEPQNVQNLQSASPTATSDSAIIVPDLVDDKVNYSIASHPRTVNENNAQVETSAAALATAVHHDDRKSVDDSVVSLPSGPVTAAVSATVTTLSSPARKSANGVMFGNPPPFMYLSDGGHLENLGLLTLLKLLQSKKERSGLELDFDFDYRAAGPRPDTWIPPILASFDAGEDKSLTMSNLHSVLNEARRLNFINSFSVMNSPVKKIWAAVASAVQSNLRINAASSAVVSSLLSSLASDEQARWKRLRRIVHVVVTLTEDDQTMEISSSKQTNAASTAAEPITALYYHRHFHLFYVKLMLTGNETDGLIFLRALSSEDFPHHSTSNQMLGPFDMEAYMKLGEVAASELLELMYQEKWSDMYLQAFQHLAIPSVQQNQTAQVNLHQTKNPAVSESGAEKKDVHAEEEDVHDLFKCIARSEGNVKPWQWYRNRCYEHLYEHHSRYQIYSKVAAVHEDPHGAQVEAMYLTVLQAAFQQAPEQITLTLPFSYVQIVALMEELGRPIVVENLGTLQQSFARHFSFRQHPIRLKIEPNQKQKQKYILL